MLYTGEVTRKFKQALGDFALLDGSRGVLVGYSGGADSSAMLGLLRVFCAELGIFLKAVHIHHGIRGAEADRDAAHCREVCLRLGIEFEVVYADIPALARENGRGIEETARDFRYAEFSRILGGDARLDRVATAHNADDNAETILFNLVRGTGIDGLAGIPPLREIGGGVVIRPLIYCSKAEILGYCRENGIEYIFDSTNDDTSYSRNYIRNELLPRLARLNPAYLSAFGRLASSARSDAEFLASAADGFTGENSKDASVDLRALADAPEAIASRVFKRVFSRISDEALESVHVKSLAKLIKTSTEGSRLSLPGDITAKIEGGRLCFIPGVEPEPPEFYLELKPGINRLENPDFAVLLIPDASRAEDFEKDNECLKNIYKLSIHVLLKSDKINHILFVRPKQDGDTYIFGKMTRKLKKLYNGRDLDIKRRKTLPVFCDGEGILWVPGFPAADRAVWNDIADSPFLGATEIYYYCNDEV